MRPANNDGFFEKIVESKRVSKKTTGGNTMSITVLVVVGDKKGKVGAGYAKSLDMSTAISKAVTQAKRNLININISNGTIPYDVEEKYSSAKVFLKPAPKGSGIIAGGVIRTVLELSGISDISSKMLGSSNKICNVRCTIKALQKLRG